MIPIYTQSEADRMLGLPKIAAYETQIYTIPNFIREGFKTASLSAEADPPCEVEFDIATQVNFDIHAYCIVLSGKMGSRPWAALCRYDVHDNPHPNKPDCSQPGILLPGVFHVHRYNYARMIAGGVWDDCAEDLPMEVTATAAFSMQLRDLIGRFITDMRLRFSDTATMLELFKTRTP